MTFFWGTTFIAIKLSLVEISPMFYVAVRFFVASAIYIAVFNTRLFPVNRLLLKAAWPVCLLLFAGYFFQTLGLRYTSAAKSGFITGLYVIFTPLLQMLITRRPPPRAVWLASVLVLIGLQLLSSGSSAAISWQTFIPVFALADFNLGDFFTLLCAILYALYIIGLDRLTQSDLAAEPNFTLKLGFLQLLFCTAGGLLFSAAFERIYFTPSPLVIGLLFYIAVFATLITTLIQTRYQRDTTPARAAVIFMLEALFSAVLAYFILGETLGAAGYIGAGIMFAGFGVIVFDAYRSNSLSK